MDGTTFTVKDNIDIAGRRTSYGSPAWRDAHPAPMHNAVCVDQLLAAGARCVGKAIADEFTHSLDGENQFFGTPRNVKALRNLQSAEFQSTVGTWIETAKPELGIAFSMAYGNVQRFDRIAAMDSLARCERLLEKINAYLVPGTVICFPTTPVTAPLKGTLTSLDAVLDFYDRTMTITAFAGVARLPKITAPLLTVDGCPVGLSFASGHYQDEFLLKAVGRMLN